MIFKPFQPYFSLTSILLVAPFFLWGTAMVAMKGAIPHSTPFFMAAVRLIPAGVLLLIVARLTDRPQPQGKIAWLWIGLFAIVDGTLFQGFLAQGLVRTTAGLGSVTIDSQPLAVALMSTWLFREKIGIVGTMGLIVGLMGISAIALPTEWLHSSIGGSLGEHFYGEDLFARGEWLMLLAALSMAVGTVLIPFVTRYVDPVVATGWHMIIGGLPLAVSSGVLESNQWTNINGTDWLGLGYATIFGSAIAYGLFFYFASKGNLTSLSSLTFLTPVFALFFGNLFLGETLNSFQWMGVGLTLVSIALINRRSSLNDRLNGLLPSISTSSSQILSSKILPAKILPASQQNKIGSIEIELEEVSVGVREIELNN